MNIPKCKHYHTECLHGDEIWARMKVFFIRFWREPIIYRQICMDCHEPLDRPAICTSTGTDLHEWNGVWHWN